MGLSGPAPEFGLGVALQLVPSKCTASGFCWVPLGFDSPSEMSLAAIAAVARNKVCDGRARDDDEGVCQQGAFFEAFHARGAWNARALFAPAARELQANAS